MTYNILSQEQYKEDVNSAFLDADNFWANIAQEFHWFKDFTTVANCDFHKGEIKWFEDGTTNLAYNCLDRHLEKNAHKTAIIFEPNEPDAPVVKLTYQELHEKVCQFANFLMSLDVKIGDRVCIYMPMIPEAAVAMLACARIGAVHCVVFAGFSAKALAGRIADCGASTIITADLLFRGDKTLRICDIASEALSESDVKNVVMYQRDASKSATIQTAGTISIWQEHVPQHDTKHEAPALNAEDALFILYTSGSTGKPKGIMHTLGGYMTYAGYSFQNVFQNKAEDIFFCTADVGWITGHSYLVYGPLLNAATTIMFEGVPTYPTPSRFWQIVQKHQVNIFYTAPTAIRALMHKGDGYVDGFDMPSLKTLGSVGEPINQEAWLWYHQKVGKEKCAIVDTWWQTETGGILISSLAGVTQSKPTFAGKPLPGVKPILLDEDGVEITQHNQIGNLCFKEPWPSMLRGVWGDKEKFMDTYFSRFAGYYFAGDGAFFDEQGNYRVIGRVDDVINVSGHRLGTAEIENAINMHEKVSESAVIGYPHPIKGEGICAFVIAKEENENLASEIVEIIKKEIGSIAKPDKIHITSDLPKTRSGKIMRRILKKILAKEEDLGDISTLVNPEVIEKIKNLSLCN